MTIHASREVNNLLFVLIGERLLQADEDMAYKSHEPYDRLGKRLTELSDLIERSVVEVGRSLPPSVGRDYVRAMNLFVDDRGTNYLKDFATELDTIAQGRVQTSMNIIEAKWQIIAEVVRLLIELAITLILSIFSGGSGAGNAAVARAQSRVVILTVLDNLMRRTHLMPSLSEAFDEAFTTFAVRLAMIAFGPDGRRPHGFDWGQIVQDAVFGAFTGLFHGAFSHFTDKLGAFFKKGHFDSTVVKNIGDDVVSKIDHAPPSLGRNFVKGIGDDSRDFVVEGGAETAGEFVTTGLFTGAWTTSWDTFLGAGISGVVGAHLSDGVAKFGAQFNVNALNTLPGNGEGTGATTTAGRGTGTGRGTSTGARSGTRTGTEGADDRTRPAHSSSGKGLDADAETTHRRSRRREQPGVEADGSEENSPMPATTSSSPSANSSSPSSSSSGPSTVSKAPASGSPASADEERSTRRDQADTGTTAEGGSGTGTPTGADGETAPHGGPGADTAVGADAPSGSGTTAGSGTGSGSGLDIEAHAGADPLRTVSSASPDPAAGDLALPHGHDATASAAAAAAATGGAAMGAAPAPAPAAPPAGASPSPVSPTTPASRTPAAQAAPGAPGPAATASRTAATASRTAGTDPAPTPPRTVSRGDSETSTAPVPRRTTSAADPAPGAGTTPESRRTVTTAAEADAAPTPIRTDSRTPGAVPPGERPTRDVLVETVTEPSAVASGPRALVGTTTADGRALQVLEVLGDGDCFFTSVLASLHRQHPGAELAGLDVTGLRERTSAAFTAPEATADADPVDLVVGDLDFDDLNEIFENKPPALHQPVRKAIDDALTADLYRHNLLEELKGTTRGVDRALLGALPLPALRSLQPAFGPNLEKALKRSRPPRVQAAQAELMRTDLRGRLATDGPEAELLWQRTVQRAYPRWAAGRPPTLAQLRTRRFGDLVGASVLDADLWATPYFDHAVPAIAQALDLDLVVVQEGRPPQHQNPGAATRVYVHYDGRAHYSALAYADSGPTPVSVAAPAPAPATTSAGESFEAAPADRAAALAGLLRGGAHPTPETALAALGGLSRDTVEALLRLATPQGPSAQNPPNPQHPPKDKNNKEKNNKGKDKGKDKDKPAQSPARKVTPVLAQPGYATGDQFGIAAALLGNTNLHVVVVSGPSEGEGADPRDKGRDIVEFYRASGIEPERIHHETVASLKSPDVKERGAALLRRLNPQLELTPGEMRKHGWSVGGGTLWVGDHFSADTRRDVRAAWKLDDQGFPATEREKVADWLRESKGVTLAPGREVIVLWSRFSGKRGDIHVEHDTSYRGMDQLLDGLRAGTGDRDPGPLVIIAGDAKVNSQRPDHYSDMTARHRADGLDVHDLTDFWKDTDAVHPWGGDDRVGQMRLYEFLHRQSGGRLRHLGFRSGNLEAMALSGHTVRYLEEPDSIGGNRMAKWHAANSTAPLTTGYERIVIGRPPTVSGQIAVGIRNQRTEVEKEFKSKKSLAPDSPEAKQYQDSVNRLTHAFEHPAWVLGRNNVRGAEKPDATAFTKGFADKDVRAIVGFLTEAHTSAQPAPPGTHSATASPEQPTSSHSPLSDPETAAALPVEPDSTAVPPGGPGSPPAPVGEPRPRSGRPMPRHSPPPLNRHSQHDFGTTRRPFLDGGGDGEKEATPTRLVTRPVTDRNGPAVRTLDEGVVPDQRLRSSELPGGQASYTPSDWARRAGRFPAVTAAQTYSDHRTRRNVLVGEPKATPWRDTEVSFFAAHGTPTRVVLATEDGGTVTVSGRELARYLQRRAELGAEGRPIVLYSCSTGGAPVHGGLPVAQHVANVTGRPVFAPTTVVGTAVDDTGQVRSILHLAEESGTDVVPGEWKTFTPEPSGGDLDALARAAGLHDGTGPADPWAGLRTLQLVRTLRGTTGPDSDTDGELLRGLAALEALRWNGTAHPYTDGRMTADLLTRVTRDTLGLSASATPTPEQYAAVLTAARTAEPGTAPDRLSVPAVPPVTAPRTVTGTGADGATPAVGTTREAAAGRSEAPARHALRESGKGKAGKPKQSKAEKAALHDKGTSAGPDPRLKKLLVQPGYATGDQFGIAATLLGDKNMHVVVVTDPTDARDKGPDMAEFYLGSGIEPERVILQPAKKADTKKVAADVWRGLNAEVLLEAAKPSNRQMDDLIIPVGAGTTWIGENFNAGLRDEIRAAWRLDDGGFPPRDREKVADWLRESKGITLAPGREVIVLWSRFSGKRGDIHVEHDTSYRGMDQLLDALHARTADRDPGPLVLIAGDAKVNPQRPDHYPDMTARHRADGLDVHDLTDFWKDTDAVHPWGGDTRVGQMRLYEYLRDRSGGRLKHLGFRSGNLEALALTGHGVRYLEEPGSIGGSRMEKWHAANSTAALATGYERIGITRPPTVSGQIAVEARTAWTDAKRLGTLGRDQLNDLAREFEHPGWVPGRDNAPLVAKPVKAGHTKGFAPEDVDKIADYLVPRETAAHGTLTEGMKTPADGPIVRGARQFELVDIPGDGDCFFRSVLTGARLQAPDSELAGLTVPQLREQAANRFTGSEAYTVLNRQDTLDELIRDLTTGQLRQVLGGPLPELSAAERARIEERLVEEQYRSELRRTAASRADLGILTDLPASAVRALQPGHRPDPALIPDLGRARMVADGQGRVLRERLKELLSQDGARAEAAWRELLDLRYPRWAAARPDLASVRARGLGDLVADSIRDVDQWATPFFDHAPGAVAVALDLRVVVVRSDGDGVPDEALNGAAPDALYVHYNGVDHYSALSVSDAPEASATPGVPGVPAAPEQGAPAGPLTHGTASAATPEEVDAGPVGLDDLVAFLRASAPEIEQRTLDRLRDLSDETVAALLASSGRRPADPPPAEPGAPAEPADRMAPAAQNPFTDIESELLTHRPPRLDRSLVPPPRSAPPVAFSDGSRLPDHLDGSYGHGRAVLRGTDQVVREIADRADLPDGVRDHLERALRTTPGVFHGDGYLSPAFEDAHGRWRVMRVTTRPHGRWERFADVHGAPVKVDAGQRSQVAVGGNRTVADSTRLAGSLPIGPPAGPVAYGRVGAAVTHGRTYDYAMQDQTLSQVETRRGDGSHVHLDDVQYEVSFEGAPTATRRGRLPRAFAAGEGHFTFGVRGGLSLRLPDGETTPGEPDRVPRTLALGPSTDYRLVHTEGYGPVEALRKWALERTGARVGSAAHAEISAFFTTESFHRMADRLARGPVTTRQLLGADARRAPVGAFVVERVVPGEAVLLTETEAAEMRNTVQRTVKNERGLSTSYGYEVHGVLGPSVDLVPSATRTGVRAMLGAVGRYARGVSSGQVFGGSGGRKIVGRAKKVPTELYRVHKTVYVRGAGDAEPTAFHTWSLDRMTRTEARRHAGWDDGTRLRATHGNEPFAPVYLTDDAPAVLGMARPEAFTRDTSEGHEPTLLREFTDQVIRAAAARYPDLIAPLEELDGRTGRLRDPARHRTALQNTLAVINALSHHSMSGGLETVVTTGLRITLTGTGPRRGTRAHRYLWIDGRLTGRTYEGTQNDLILRGSAPGTERLDGSQSGNRTLETGFDAGLVVRDGAKDLAGAPKHLGALTAGPRWAWQKGRKTAYGSTVSHEGLAVSAAPSHLHSYELELTAKSGGHWRPRGLWRGLPTLGLLGTGLFVRAEPETDLVGGTATAAAVRGRVLLAVPDEHTPAADPHAGRAAPAAPATESLTGERARALATGDTRGAGEDHADPFGDLAYQTIGVGGHKELAGAVEDVLRTASGGSWHFGVSGAPAHDSAVRPFQPSYLTASFDQTSGPAGSRIGGLFGKGPYIDRLADVVHRTRVLRPVVVSRPVKLETEQTVGGDTQSSGAVTTSHSFTVTGGGSYGASHPTGPSLAGSYGLFGRWSRSRGTAHTVTRTVTSEINRDDEGYKVLVSGDTQHDVLAATRTGGLLSPVYDLATRFRAGWAGRRLTFAADWLGHLPEKAAHRLGLIQDRLGEVPRYAEKAWRRPPWLRDHPFGSYPVNSLDTSEVLAAFDRDLRGLNADDASRERVRSLVSPRAVRALRDQLVSTGAPARTRVGRLNLGRLRLGGRSGALRVELLEDEPHFDGLDHSTTLQDTRTAAETVEDTVSTERGWGAGTAVGEGVRTGAAGAPAAGPVLGTTGATARQTVTGRSRTRWKSSVFYPNEPHAEFLTGYRLRLTLTLDNGQVVRREGTVGQLREQVPLSLVTPQDDGPADDPLGPPRLPTAAPEVTVWQRGGVTREAIDAWRGDGTATPFRMPPSGFQARRVTDPDGVHTVAELAVARAYGLRAARTAGADGTLRGKALETVRGAARQTALTRPGTASAQALEGGTGNAALAAFFDDAVSGEGHRVAGLVDPSTAGAQGEFRLYARPDLAGARLLTVAPDSTMESAERETDGADVTVTRSDVQDAVLGGQAVVAADAAGSVVPGAGGTASNAADTDAARHPGADGVQLNVKPKTGRSFLFAIPTDWLGVAEVEHDVKDSAVATLLGRALAPLGPLGRVRPGPQAVETRGHVLAWVREDVARDLGLIGDATFPPRVADAWARTSAAGTAWADADKKYWKARRALAERREEHAAATRRRTAAKSRLDAAPAAGAAAADAVREARGAVRDATADRRAAARELHSLWQDMTELRAAAERAAATFHTVRTATDRLTRWHQLPARPAPADGTAESGAPERRAGLEEPPGPDFAAPAAVPAVEPARFTEQPDAVLTSPSGEEYTLLDVPEDGDGFYHALAEGLHHGGTGLPEPLPSTSRRDLVDGLRAELVDTLRSSDDAGLLALAVPDRTDTFAPAELAAAGVDFGENTPQGREYAASDGRLPLYGTLTDEQRLALATTQLSRPGTTGSGWDHGAADLLPTLAARRFGVTVTVVREDGTFQDFAPSAPAAEDRPRLVLHLKGRHYRPAVPRTAPSRTPLPAPVRGEQPPRPPRDERRPPRDDRRPARPAHTSAPWNARPAPGGWRRDPGAGPGTLTAPDGTVHDLVEPTGDGNNFWTALTAADPRGSTRALGGALPPTAVLDRDAPFTWDELTAASVHLGAADAERFHAGGGRLPDGLALTPRQERALILTQLRTARHWNEATARTAARMAADADGTTVTIVTEDGSAHVVPPSQGTFPAREVTLYQRGAEYLSARPRPPVGISPDDPDFLDLEITRADAEGLSPGGEAAIVWTLNPGAALPVRELDLDAAGRRELFQRIGHRLGPAVTAEVARSTYGMPEKNFDKFRRLAGERRLVIDVRPTNPTAPKWLDQGMLPKPKDIKAKTIGEVDVHLGARREHIGLVGYFQPAKPDRSGFDDTAWQRIEARYAQRLDEFEQLAPTMARLAEQDRFHVRDGLVMGRAAGDPEGPLKAITGDHDIFDLATPGGSRLDTPTYDAAVEAMTHNDMAVMHGAHLYWRAPRSPFSEGVFTKIAQSHGPGGEPLVRFRPENENGRLVHYRGVPNTATGAASGAAAAIDSAAASGGGDVPPVITRDLVWQDSPPRHDHTATSHHGSTHDGQ